MARLRRNRKRTEGASRRPLAHRILKIIGLALAVLLSAVPALFLADPIAYVPPIAFVLALVASYASLAYVARNLHVNQGGLANSCSRGESAMLDVEIDNRAYVPVTRMELVFIIMDEKGGLDVTTTVRAAIGAHKTLPLTFDAVFAHLGRYSCGIDYMVIYDYFGLFKRRIDIMHHDPISVLPHLFDVGDTDLTHVSQQESQNLFKTIDSDDSDYAGVREYRYGDPMKTVHWNLSSRDPYGRLFTRLFEVAAEPGLAVIIDPYAPPYSAEELRGTFDALVEAAASVSSEARRQGVETEVRFLDTEGAPTSLHLSRMSDIDDLVERMLSVERADEVARATEPVAMLEREARSANGHDNVAYCTSRLGEDVLNLLLSLRMRRRNPLLFFAVPRSLSDDERQKATRSLKRLDAAGINYFVVDSNEVKTEVRSR